MDAETLCEQLIQAADTPEQNALLERAAAIPECLTHLLDTARQQTHAAPPAAILRAHLAVRLAERRQEGRMAAQAWRIMGQAQRVQGDHARAAETLAVAAATAAQAGDALLATQVQVGRIDSMGWLGRFDEALALARRLEIELRAMGEETEAAKALVNMGALYYRRDQHAQARGCYERALAIFAQSGEEVAQATVQTNLAAVLMELHQVDDAIALFEQARAIFAANALLTPAAKVDANIGFLHYLSGRYAQALAALQRARDEFAVRAQTLDAAKCDADMAEAYRELNLRPEALEAYARAIRDLESLGVTYERARAELGQASVWMAAGRQADALEGLERAATLFRAHRNTTQLAHARLLRAHLLRRENRTDEARHEANRAASAFARRGLRGWAAEARFLTAEMMQESGEDAARLLHAVLRTAKTQARGWLQCRAERALGQHYLRRNEKARGLRHLRAGVQALEQSRTLIAPEEMHVAFLRDKLAIYEEIVGALLRRGRRQDILEALEYVERAKSRLLLERVQTAVQGRGNEEGREENAPEAGDTRVSEFTERLEHLRAQLSRGYHRLNALDEGEARRIGPAGADDLRTLTMLEQEYRSALREAELAGLTLVSGLLAFPTIISAKALQDALDKDEILVEFYIVSGSVCAWVITAEEVHFRADIACMENARFAARRLRYQLQRGGGGRELSQRHAQRFQADAQAVLRQLYDLLLRPLADLMPTEKIVIVPHGDLHGLPFHAFYDGAQYALDRWEMIYAPSAAVWHATALQKRTPATPDNADNTIGTAEALLVAVPLPGIEQVAAEVEELARLLPHARVLSREAATLDAVLQHAPHCRLLHLATHALHRADNPLFSGLQLADGWLLARDLYTMRLHCDLATLSACQTGVVFVEAGDELFGLIRGFLAAGARSVAASLWPADDQATAALMQPFYTRLLQGESKAAALRAAQRSLRREFPHPYHWAAFALIGERGENLPTCPTGTASS